MRLNQPRLRAGVAVGAISWPRMFWATKAIKRSKMMRRFMGNLNSSKVFWVAKFVSNPLSSGMKTFCVFALCVVFALANSAAKKPHCTLGVHAQANPRDTEVFATSLHAQISGRNVAIERMAWISEHDVTAFSPYPAQDGTYGALIQLDEHGRVILDSLSIERRGGFLFIFVNGRLITPLSVDKRVSDGKIYIPSGLTAADINLMKKDWHLIGQSKPQSH